jgi:addiction module HigA family antidote
MSDNLPPIHPGRLLRKDIEALGLTIQEFAKHIRVPHEAVANIVNGEQSISTHMAIRLSKAFGSTAQYWLNLQSIYDVKLGRVPD